MIIIKRILENLVLQILGISYIETFRVIWHYFSTWTILSIAKIGQNFPASKHLRLWKSNIVKKMFLFISPLTHISLSPWIAFILMMDPDMGPKRLGFVSRNEKWVSPTVLRAWLQNIPLHHAQLSIAPNWYSQYFTLGPPL